MVVSSSTTSAGQLVVFSGLRSGYTITADGTYSPTVTVRNLKTGARSKHAGPVRFQFSDRNVAWNNWALRTNITTDLTPVDGPAHLYRLYHAAFGRKPDLAGIGYWIKASDSGISLTDIAGSMALSSEMGGVTDTRFIEKVYFNLHGQVVPAETLERVLGWLTLWQHEYHWTPLHARGIWLAKVSGEEAHRRALDSETRNGVEYIPAP